jgi:glycosyltransferase involved in cell wall biosynthesis
MQQDLVSIIIPVHNAGAYLGETLRSALNQTYPVTEIIVVDDGSTDRSLEIARGYARDDSRIQIFQQPQRGPSAARNLGIAKAKGELIAPLDADDLWRPTKLERQVAVMQKGGSRIGLVYTWFALIDGQGVILSTGHHPMAQGEVLRECCRRNIVGNGSGAMMRKCAIVECGGYDEQLSRCEDYKLYVAIAERYLFGMVPEHLTGYRQTNQNLTSNILMMCKSGDLVFSELEQRHPKMGPEIRAQRLEFYHWLVRRGALARSPGLLRVAWEMWSVDPFFALRSLSTLPKDVLSRGSAKNEQGDGRKTRYFLPGNSSY